MDVTHNARGSGTVSSMAARSTIAHPVGLTATELQGVHMSPVNALARPYAAVPSNRGDTSRNLRVPHAVPSAPDTSNMWFRSGGYYIQGHKRDIAVYSLDNWVTTRMRDPRWPHGPGLPLRWHCGRWRVDDGASPNATTPLDWWNFGLVGSEPPTAVELPEFTEVLISTVLYPFDFPAGPVGDLLKNWFVHDWFNPLPSQEGGWPAWAIKYAKCNAVLSLYCGQRQLSGAAL